MAAPRIYRRLRPESCRAISAPFHRIGTRQHADTRPEPEFLPLVAGARPPCRADSLADGTLPLRAVRRCDALTTASGFGGWIFPALDVWLLRDGHPILWSADGEVQ